jgi:hypothetical protein
LAAQLVPSRTAGQRRGRYGDRGGGTGIHGRNA